MNDKEIGKRLRILRKFYKLTQEDFSRRIKVHQSTLALFESGDRLLKDIYIKIICDEFDCSRDWLLEGKGEMIKTKKEISLDEYAKIYDLSILEKDILIAYMEISPSVRAEFVQEIGRVLREKYEYDIKNTESFDVQTAVYEKENNYHSAHPENKK